MTKPVRSRHSLDKLDKGMIHIRGGTEKECVRLHHATRNGMQFKTFELFISEISHLVFSDLVFDHGELKLQQVRAQIKGTAMPLSRFPYSAQPLNFEDLQNSFLGVLLPYLYLSPK